MWKEQRDCGLSMVENGAREGERGEGWIIAWTLDFILIKMENQW